MASSAITTLQQFSRLEQGKTSNALARGILILREISSSRVIQPDVWENGFPDATTHKRWKLEKHLDTKIEEFETLLWIAIAHLEYERQEFVLEEGQYKTPIRLGSYINRISPEAFPGVLRPLASKAREAAAKLVQSSTASSDPKLFQKEELHDGLKKLLNEIEDAWCKISTKRDYVWWNHVIAGEKDYKEIESMLNVAAGAIDC